MANVMLEVTERQMQDKESLIGHFKKQLVFQDYCSVRSWDAFSDCLDQYIIRSESKLMVRHVGKPGLGREDIKTYIEILGIVRSDHGDSIEMSFDFDFVESILSG